MTCQRCLGIFAVLKTPHILSRYLSAEAAGASDVTNVSASQNDCRCCNVGNIKYEKHTHRKYIKEQRA
jgi:hypothetical protein